MPDDVPINALQGGRIAFSAPRPQQHSLKYGFVTAQHGSDPVGTEQLAADFFARVEAAADVATNDAAQGVRTAEGALMAAALGAQSALLLASTLQQAQAAQYSVLVYVHGYNTSFQTVRKSRWLSTQLI